MSYRSVMNKGEPPHFLPPNTRRPLASLVKMDTKERLRKAMVPLGVFVASGRLDFFDAHDILCRAFIAHVWTGRSIDTFMKFETDCYTALLKSVSSAEAGMQRILEWESRHGQQETPAPQIMRDEEAVRDAG